ALERAERHLARGLLADRAVPFDGFGAHAEHLLLGLVRIGDEAALEPRRGAGNRGELLSRPAAGARLSSDQHAAVRFEARGDFFGQGSHPSTRLMTASVNRL